MLRNTSPTDKQLIYPTAAATAIGSRQAPLTRVSSSDLYSGNMNIIATCEEFNSGDKLYSVVNGEIRGAAIDIDVAGENFMFITVAGDELNRNDDVKFVIEKANGEELIASTRLLFNNNYIYGTIDDPVEISFNGELYDGVLVYPVPFNESVTVTARASQNATMFVEVLDVAGSLIYRSNASTVSEGMIFKQTINTTSFVQGVYLINVYENDSVTTCKAIKE